MSNFEQQAAIDIYADGAPDFLKVPEVAPILRVDRARAYELAKTGQIPTVRWGGTIRVPRRALIEHLERLAAESVAG